MEKQEIKKTVRLAQKVLSCVPDEFKTGVFSSTVLMSIKEIHSGDDADHISGVILYLGSTCLLTDEPLHSRYVREMLDVLDMEVSLLLKLFGDASDMLNEEAPEDLTGLVLKGPGDLLDAAFIVLGVWHAIRYARVKQDAKRLASLKQDAKRLASLN
ncbi:MAG: hypothetical protein D6800_00075 [Candidatus Zixiibacteriota bacterium]|nr:MAG: hypothetical protein D6800_00075 [candidate division Zixibacteria bacterium]